jgi:hypothetical protein
MRRSIVAAPALAVLLGVSPVAAEPAPLEQARKAAAQTSFDGVLQVRWRDGDEIRSERLTIQSAGGSLMVRGANQVMARPTLGPLLAHAGGGWEEMWLPSLAPGPRPDGYSKYQATGPAPGAPVAGRAAKVIEVRHSGVLVERVHLDTQTDLLLQRDQFDAAGGLVRTLAFESLTLRPSADAPDAPRTPAHRAPHPVDPDRLSPSMAAPASMDDGYQRIGVYRRGSVVQVLYSDGLYDLSLFEQPGRLRRSELPSSGERVSIGRVTGWRYPWPGGQLVVWSTAGKVFTAVSDAPVDQVLAAVRSLPPTSTRELSLLGKLRRACQALMEPLS